MANRAEAVRLMNIDSLADRLVKWLGDLDSNQDSQIQNLESYRWTISHPLRRKMSCPHSKTNATITLHF